MRVAVDATPLSLSTGGTSRYTTELGLALAETYPEDEILLVSDQPFKMPPLSPLNLRAGNGPRGWRGRRWWLLGLESELSQLGADVFHGTDFAVPYLGTRPSVMTLHDLSPWMDPAWHVAADRVRRRAPFLIGLGLATVVVTGSEAIRRQAMEYFGLPSTRVAAVPLAASSLFRPVPQTPSREPYFFYAGALEPRKNLLTLLDAWREVRRAHPVNLVLAGRRRADFEALAPEPGLHLLGEVSDDDLPALYSGAIALVYPSLYEGFGLPVLEAMRCGAAVITSRDPAVSEVAGGAALQLDARDTRAWVEAMIKAVRDPEWLGLWRERGLLRAEEFSWVRAARGTREVYEEAIRQFGR